MTRKNSQPNKSAVAPEKALLATRPARNIKFIGRPTFAPGKRKILEDPQPLERISDRGQMITLPPADFQKRARLFYHEHATLIADAYPFLYKVIRSKGK